VTTGCSNLERLGALALLVNMDGLTGLEVLAQVRTRAEAPFVIIMTAFAEWDTAVRAMRLGAYNFLRKPFDNTSVRVLVNRALAAREHHVAAKAAGVLAPLLIPGAGAGKAATAEKLIARGTPEVIEAIEKAGAVAERRAGELARAGEEAAALTEGATAPATEVFSAPATEAASTGAPTQPPSIGAPTIPQSAIPSPPTMRQSMLPAARTELPSMAERTIVERPKTVGGVAPEGIDPLGKTQLGAGPGRTYGGVAPEGIDPFAATLEAPPRPGVGPATMPPTMPPTVPPNRGGVARISAAPELAAPNAMSTEGILGLGMRKYDKAILLNRGLTEIDGVVGRMIEGKFVPGYWSPGWDKAPQFMAGTAKSRTEVEAMAEVWEPFRDRNRGLINKFYDAEEESWKPHQWGFEAEGAGQFGRQGGLEGIGGFGLEEGAGEVVARRTAALQDLGARLGGEGAELEELAKRLSSHPSWEVPGAPGLKDAVLEELGAIRGTSNANRDFALAKIGQQSAAEAATEARYQGIIKASDPTAHGMMSAAELETKAANLEAQAAAVAPGRLRTAEEAVSLRSSLASEAALSGAYSVARTVDESIIQDKPLTAQMLVGSFTIGVLLPIGIGLPGKAFRALPSVMPKGSLGPWAEKIGAHSAIRQLGGTAGQIASAERYVKGGVVEMGKRVVRDVEKETGKAFWRHSDESMLKFAKEKAETSGKGIGEALRRADKAAPGGINKKEYIDTVFRDVVVPLDRAGARSEVGQLRKLLEEQMASASRHGGGLEQWHEMRVYLDGKIKWAKREAGVLVDPLRKVRASLEEAIEKKLADVGSKVGEDVLKDYAAHKASYTIYKRATDMLDRKIAAETRNQVISLGDRVVGAGLAGAVGGPHGIAAAAIGGLANKMLRDKASGVVASALLREETLSRLQRATLTVEKQMDKAAARWTQSKVLATSGASAPMSAGFFGSDPETRRKNFDNWVNDVQVHASDPGFRTDKMARVLAPIQEAAPEVAANVSASVENGIQYLRTLLPAPQMQNMLMPQLKGVGLSDAEISRIERAVTAVNSPHSQIMDFMNGSLSKEGAEAWRSVYPAHHAKFLEKLTTHLFDHKEPLSQLQLENLSTLYGEPVADRLQSGHIQTAQTLGAKPGQGQKPPPQSNGGINRLAGHYQPPSSGGGP
jgi:hypothetical protein